MSAKIECRATVGVTLVKTVGEKKLVFMGKAVDYWNSPPEDYWTMPQGGIDKGEDPATAVRRELFEETGIKHDDIKWARELDWYVIKIPKHMRWRQYEFVHHQKYRWFLAEIHHDPQVTLEPKEYVDYGWFEPMDVIEKGIFFKKEMYCNVLSSFGLIDLA